MASGISIQYKSTVCQPFSLDIHSLPHASRNSGYFDIEWSVMRTCGL
jgi:hypothetical protein